MSGLRMAKVSWSSLIGSFDIIGMCVIDESMGTKVRSLSGPEQAGKSQGWHTRVGSLLKTQIEDGRDESNVDDGLANVDYFVKSFKTTFAQTHS